MHIINDVSVYLEMCQFKVLSSVLSAPKAVFILEYGFLVVSHHKSFGPWGEKPIKGMASGII